MFSNELLSSILIIFLIVAAIAFLLMARKFVLLGTEIDRLHNEIDCLKNKLGEANDLLKQALAREKEKNSGGA
jgi:hypothetical protein